MQRYADEVAPTKGGARWEAIRIKAMQKPKTGLPFANKLIGEITPDDISTWARASKKAPASVIREASLLASVFTYARKTLRWVPTSPMKDAVLPKPTKARQQRISKAQENAIVTACGYEVGEGPTNTLQRTAVAFLFAIETCMRAGEITSIRPDDVHERHVHLPKTKNGDERDVPLSKQAVRLLKLLPKSDPVFGMTVGVMDATFRRVRARAAESEPSVAAIHFHDTRREGATRLATKVDVMELARIGGWRDVNMLLKVYYAPDLGKLADKLG